MQRANALSRFHAHPHKLAECYVCALTVRLFPAQSVRLFTASMSTEAASASAWDSRKTNAIQRLVDRLGQTRLDQLTAAWTACSDDKQRDGMIIAALADNWSQVEVMSFYGIGAGRVKRLRPTATGDQPPCTSSPRSTHVTELPAPSSERKEDSVTCQEV